MGHCVDGHEGLLASCKQIWMITRPGSKAVRRIGPGPARFGDHSRSRSGQGVAASGGTMETMQKTSARLLSLLSLLQARRDWSGALLAERLDISPRTVRRDVDRLRELGYPIVTSKGPDGGYRLGAGTQLPPLLFDDAQAVALAIALQIATTSGAGIEEAAARALTTVQQVMPARLRHRIETLHVTAVERPTTRPAPQVDSTVLMTLSAAVHARETLRFDYSSASAQGAGDNGTDAPPPRRAEPHHLDHLGRTLVPRRLGPRPRGLAHLPRRPDHPAHSHRPAFHPARTARGRRGRLRRRQVPGVGRLRRLALPR